MEGDNRDFDRNAPYTASRAQIVINPSTGEHYILLNGTRVDLVPGDGWPIPWMNGFEKSSMRHLPSDVQVVRDASSGALTVRAELYNGLCSMIGRAACPAIDATFRLTIGSDGLYQVESLQRDKYPSVQINQWVNGAWTERYRDQEHPAVYGPAFLANFRDKAVKLRLTYALPDGCERQ